MLAREIYLRHEVWALALVGRETGCINGEAGMPDIEGSKQK